MSADNGIYILRSPIRPLTDELGVDPEPWSPIREEFRVTHAQAIDNLEFEPDCQGFNTGILIDYFGKCEVFTSRDQAYELARKKADEIAMECLPLEYGISEIRLPFPFPELQDGCVK
jgi:hypothetical protein